MARSSVSDRREGTLGFCAVISWSVLRCFLLLVCRAWSFSAVEGSIARVSPRWMIFWGLKRASSCSSNEKCVVYRKDGVLMSSGRDELRE